MSVDLITLGKRLMEASTKLNTASGQLQIQFEAIEKTLKAMNLGINGSVEMGKDYFLSYERLDKTWTLTIRTKPDNPEVKVWTLADAPRALRIKAVDHLVELLEELRLRADDMTVELNSALIQAREFMKGIEK